MSGNINTRTELIPASGVVNLPNANFLFVISSTVAVTFDLIRVGLARGANRETYSGITAGLQVARTQRWDQCNLSGAAGGTVTFMYGYTDIREDVTLFNQQIAIISGVTAVAINPATTVTDTPKVTTVTGQAALFVANLARRRLTVFADPANTATVYIRKSGGANDIAFIQAGTYEEFDGTYALDYHDLSAGGQNLYLFEES